VTWHVVIRPEVDDDLLEIEAWYEEREPGLGAGFLREVRARIDNVAANPLRFRLRNRQFQVRWAYPQGFPYRIVFQVLDGVIVVLAVTHGARRRQVWRKRL
jgi:plasmid stabilization system protein ParE